MSAIGYKQTSSRPKLRSALPPKADIPGGIAEGSFVKCLGQLQAIAPRWSTTATNNGPTGVVPAGSGLLAGTWLGKVSGV